MADDPHKHRVSCLRLTGAILPRQMLSHLDVARAIQQKQKTRSSQDYFRATGRRGAQGGTPGPKIHESRYSPPLHAVNKERQGLHWHTPALGPVCGSIKQIPSGPKRIENSVSGHNHQTTVKPTQ